MRYCVHPDHIDPAYRPIPWIQDDEPDHKHEKPRYRLVEGQWVEVPRDH